MSLAESRLVNGQRSTVNEMPAMQRGRDVAMPGLVHRPPSTVHVHRPPSTVHRPPSTVHRQPSTPPPRVHRKHKTAGKSPAVNMIAVRNALCPTVWSRLGAALVVAVAAVHRLTADGSERNLGRDTAAIAGD